MGELSWLFREACSAWQGRRRVSAIFADLSVIVRFDKASGSTITLVLAQVNDI